MKLQGGSSDVSPTLWAERGRPRTISILLSLLLFLLSFFPLLAILEKLAGDPERREFLPWDFGGEGALGSGICGSVLLLETKVSNLLY